MKIKIEQSGGFAGIPFSKEIETDKLPPPIENTIKELLDGKRRRIPKGLRSRGVADYLTYKITIQNGIKDHVVECNEYDMDNNMKSLIRYVKKNSKE